MSTPSMEIVSRHAGMEFTIFSVVSYDVNIETPRTSLAKTYDIKNEMTVVLDVPKIYYTLEHLQILLKWIELPVYDKNYYRDFAVHVTMAGDNERTILFTHATISAVISTDVNADFVTIELLVRQKEDKFYATTFGEKLDDTYAAAKKRLDNPPRLNIWIPPMIKPSENIEVEMAPLPLANVPLYGYETPGMKLDCDEWKYNFNDIANKSISGLRFNKDPEHPNQQLIYCNSPELFKSEATFIGKDYELLNRVNVSSENETVFYASYEDRTNYTLIDGKWVLDPNKEKKANWIGIRIYNTDQNNSATVSVSNLAINSGGYNTPGKTWKDYNRNNNFKFVLSPNGWAWMAKCEYDDIIVESLAKFTTDKDIVVAAYACCDLKQKEPNIPAITEQPDSRQLAYSGWAWKWRITANSETIKSANLFVSNQESIFYKLCEFNRNRVIKNKDEENPITLPQDWLAEGSSDREGFDNIGNWGLEYGIKFTFTNNSSEYEYVQFKGYIISNDMSHYAGIKIGSRAESKFLGTYGLETFTDNNGKEKTYNRWKFYVTEAVAKGKTITLDLTYMHLSKGSAPCLMQWTAFPCKPPSQMHVNPS